jgi:GNAT superfamily N-acetyltransferase
MTFNAPSDVTLAMPEDEESLMDILRLRHQEDGVGDFDEISVRARVQLGIFRHQGNIGVIRKNGIIEASIGLFLTSFWYGQQQHLSDYWNYVREPYRRSTHAKHLLMFAKAYAEGLGIPLVMAKLSNDKTEPMIRLYERQLPRSGAVFVFNNVKSVA